MSIYYGYKNGYAVYRRASLDTVSAVSSGAYQGSFARYGSFGGSFSGSYGGSWYGSMGGAFAFGSLAFGSSGSLAGMSGLFSGSFKGSGISGSFAAPSESGMPEVILGYGINLI